jgi:hypothetical protein
MQDVAQSPGLLFRLVDDDAVNCLIPGLKSETWATHS